MDEKLYMVETISIFRHRYVVSAREAEHAADEVIMNTSGMLNDSFTEFSQKHIEECITSVREISAAEYMKMFDEDNDYLQSWEDTEKIRFVNVIKYKDDE